MLGRSRREILIAGACLLFAVLNIAMLMMPRKRLPANFDEVPDKRLSLYEREEQVQQQLRGVAKHDQEISARMDLPADQIPDTPSLELLNHFSTSGMRVWLKLYDDTKWGSGARSRARQH